MAVAAPLLAQPVLGGVDTLDTAAVQFLLAQTLLERQRKEEEEEREAGQMAKMEEQRMLQIDAMIAEGLVVSQSWWLSCCFLLDSFSKVQEEEEKEEGGGLAPGGLGCARVPRHPCAHAAQQSFLMWILKVPQFSVRRQTGVHSAANHAENRRDSTGAVQWFGGRGFL